MANQLQDNDNGLPTINYEHVIDTIVENIDDIEVIKNSNYIDLVNVHQFASQVKDKILEKHGYVFKSLDVDLKLSPNDITVNYKNYERYANKIKSLNKKIPELVEPGEIQPVEMKKLKNSAIPRDINFGFTSPFAKSTLCKNVMSFEKDIQSVEKIRVDKVKVELCVQDVQEQLHTSLCNLIDDEVDSEIECEQIKSAIRANRNTDIYRLIQVLNTNSIARISRNISYVYMDYLLNNASEMLKQCKAYKIAKAYVNRFKLLDEYLLQLSNEVDEKAIVKTDKGSFNLCDLLYRGNAFDVLPVIGLVDGTLFEHKEDKKKNFEFAVHMKLNGAVQNTHNNDKQKVGQPSYLYHLNLLKKDEKNQMRLRTLFLYVFMFYNLNQHDFNPISYWEKIKPELENDFDSTATIISNLLSKPDSNAYKHVGAIEHVFKNLIDNKSSSMPHNCYHYFCNLILSAGVLAEDIQSSHVVKHFEFETEYLKYVSVVDSSAISNGELLNIPINIDIKSISLYQKGNRHTTEQEYQIDNLKALPVVMYPGRTGKPGNDRALAKGCEGAWNKANVAYHIRIPHTLEIEKVLCGPEQLLYVITYLTTVYLILDKMLKSVTANMCSKDLYIPIVRIHTTKQKSAENGDLLTNHVRDIGKTLEHILGAEYRACSQGFVIDKPKKDITYCYKNAVSSMYARLPKIFKGIEKLAFDKIAVITVTSRKSDSLKLNNPNRYIVDDKLVLLGELILFEQLKDGGIICDSYKTFSECYNDKKLYAKPTILADIVREAYDKGYHKIIYVAKAPYTSSLNVTEPMKAKYFMSEEVIKLMKENKPGLVVYPLYYEQFMAFDYDKNKKAGALYVSSTKEIDDYVMENNKSIAGVLNLYSGRVLNTKKIYNSVIIYSTLSNMYGINALNAEVTDGLIKDGVVKNSIVEILILLHYARYEAGDKDSIKINPYERIIGDDGVSTRSVQKINTSRTTERTISFNMLAFLTDIKKIIEGDN